jgi:hypothetical protein
LLLGQTSAGFPAKPLFGMKMKFAFAVGLFIDPALKGEIDKIVSSVR